jgi:hypothetical protein
MRTRSQSKMVELDVNIDFDGAHAAWTSNKKRVGQGYTYVCGTRLANGKPCQCKPFRQDETASQTGPCRRHWIPEEDEGNENLHKTR